MPHCWKSCVAANIKMAKHANSKPVALYFSLSIDDSEVLNVRPQNTMWEYGGLDRDGDIDNPWRGAGKMAPFDQQVILRFTFSVPIMTLAICFLYFDASVLNSVELDQTGPQNSLTYKSR